jgi:hypothetical protein
VIGGADAAVISGISNAILHAAPANVFKWLGRRLS